jgi:hypothetical protein
VGTRFTVEIPLILEAQETQESGVMVQV